MRKRASTAPGGRPGFAASRKKTTNSLADRVHWRPSRADSRVIASTRAPRRFAGFSKSREDAASRRVIYSRVIQWSTESGHCGAAASPPIQSDTAADKQRHSARDPTLNYSPVPAPMLREGAFVATSDRDPARSCTPVLKFLTREFYFARRVRGLLGISFAFR